MFECPCISVLFAGVQLYKSVSILLNVETYISFFFFFDSFQIQLLHRFVPSGSRWRTANHLRWSAVRTQIWNVLYEAPQQV